MNKKQIEAEIESILDDVREAMVVSTDNCDLMDNWATEEEKEIYHNLLNELDKLPDEGIEDINSCTNCLYREECNMSVLHGNESIPIAHCDAYMNITDIGEEI